MIKKLFLKIMSYISTFKNTWPAAFWLSILSFILALIPFLYSLIVFFPPSKLWGTWLFLIPFLCILFIFLIFFFLHKKFPIIINLIVVPIVLYIIFIVQFCMGLILFSFLFCTNEEHKFDKPQYYEEVLEYINSKDRVSHFPKHIPENAKNIEMGGHYLSIFGSEHLFLKFDTNKKYIENELKNHKFISVEKYDEFKHRNSYLGDGKTYKINDFTYYIINDRENQKPIRHCFPYHFGIAVNKDKNQIIYYYSDPD